MMKKTASYLFIVAVTILSSCSKKQGTHSKPDKAKLKLIITNVMYVGWGAEYQANIKKTENDHAFHFHNPLVFGAISPIYYDSLGIGDSCIVTFHNTRQQNKESYLPAMNGTVSLSNELWEIEEIEILTTHQKLHQ